MTLGQTYLIIFYKLQKSLFTIKYMQKDLSATCSDPLKVRVRVPHNTGEHTQHR